MYGLINKSIEGLITNQFGAEAWKVIKAKAGADSTNFVGLNYYPDDVTYELVFKASEYLNIPVHQLLESFGEYWVLYVAEEGYGDFLKMGGDSLPEFLGNLNKMHATITKYMPELVVPRFELAEQTSNSLHLHYYSTRKGLSPMVLGLVKGLGKKFNTPCTIALSSTNEVAEGTHDVFLVNW